MKKSLTTSLLVGLFFFCSSCHVSADLDIYLPTRTDKLTSHPIDCIEFLDPTDQANYYAILSEGLEPYYQEPNVQIWNLSWNSVRSFNLEPKEKATDHKKAVFYTPKQMKLWNMQWVIMNRESTLDFYSFQGEWQKRYILPIQHSEKLQLQSCFFYQDQLVLVGLDKQEEKTRILAISPNLGIAYDWLMSDCCSQVTTDGHSLFALVQQDKQTSLQQLDPIHQKIIEEKILPGLWNEIIFMKAEKSSVNYGMLKTETTSSLVEVDSSFSIVKTHWNTQFNKITVRPCGINLLIFVDDTKGAYWWEPTKGLRLLRDLASATEYSVYSYYPLCVKKDLANNLLLLDEDYKISIVNIEICHPSVLKVYDSVCLTEFKLPTNKAFAKTDHRLYFADIDHKVYEMNLNTKKLVMVHEFDWSIDQIEATEDGPLILLENSTLWRFQHNSMTQIEIPKTTILSLVVEENIPYFLIYTGEKEEIRWLDPVLKQLITLPIHISADTTSINQFTICKTFSMDLPTVFTIESTTDGDYLCIYDGDGKRLTNSAMSLIRLMDPIPIQQIFYYGSDKFLMVSQEFSSVFTFKGIKVE